MAGEDLATVHPKDWTMEHVDAAIAEAIEATLGTQAFEVNEKYIDEADHYNDGKNWVGPDGGTSQLVRTRVKKAVQRQFTPVHTVGEILDNFANALLQSEAQLDFLPRDPQPIPENETPEQREKREREEREHKARWRARLDTWAKRRNLFDKARAALRRSRWAMRGALRAWVPPATIEEVLTSGTVSRLLGATKTPEGALERVHVIAPSPRTAHVWTNPDTQQRVAVYVSEAVDGKRTAELWYAEGEEDQRRTICRVLLDGAAAAPPIPLELGGRLPIAEMEGRLLLTEPVRAQQRRQDFFESIVVRVGEAAGFPERYTLNARPSGVWSKTAPTDIPVVEKAVDALGVLWYLHPMPRTLGAATTTELRGFVSKDKDGKETIGDCSVERFEPTDPEYALKVCKHSRSTMLRECKQAHFDLDDQSETSGHARVVARAGFVADANNAKSGLEQMLAEILEAALAQAGLMNAEVREFLAAWQVVVTVKVDAGPIAAEEMTALIERVAAGLLSEETAIALSGIDDVSAEVERIRNSPKAKLALLKLQLECIKLATDAGASIEGAALIVGMDPKTAQQLAESAVERDAQEQEEADREMERAELERERTQVERQKRQGVPERQAA